jgi:hypothetical protein
MLCENLALGLLKAHTPQNSVFLQTQPFVYQEIFQETLQQGPVDSGLLHGLVVE